MSSREQAILSIGLLQPAVEVQIMTDALVHAGPAEAATLLGRHKVARIARSVAQQRHEAGGEGAEAYAALAAALTQRLRPAEQRMSTADSVLSLLATSGTTFWLMKGFAAHGAYPAGRVRDVGDIDLLVEHLDDAWALAALLRDEGYEYWRGELPWFKRDVATGEFYGQVRLVVPDRTRMSVDIHAGPYSVRHCARMPLPRSLQAAPGGPIPAAENLCCVIGNGAGDCFVDAKTINDVVLALRPDLDVNHVRRVLDTGHLLPFLRTVLHRVEQLCALSIGQRVVLQALAAPSADRSTEAEPAPPLSQSDPHHRLTQTVTHAGWTAPDYAPFAAVTKDDLMASAQAAYGRDLPLTVVEEPDGGRLPELNNWTCVRLVPAGLLSTGTEVPASADPGIVPLTKAMDVRSFAEGDLVTASETFIPTADFRIPAALVARAEAEAAALKKVRSR